MEAIILAGGLGTRLREAVPDLPKAMAPINGKPFLEVLLGYLSTQGVDHVVLSLGFLAERISAHFGDQHGDIKLSYCIEESPLGTGGAMRQAMTYVRGDHALALNGDTLVELSLAGMRARWEQTQRPVIAVRQVPNVARYGEVTLDEHGFVNAFQEKGPDHSGWINAGVYLLPADVFAGKTWTPTFSFEQDFLAKQPAGFLAAWKIDGLFIDIGVPHDYERAQHLLADWP